MFSLIITIVSIVLVTVLAVATIYYGGSAFAEGTALAEANALINGANQVASTVPLYITDNAGNPPVEVTDLLVGDYLAGEPATCQECTPFHFNDDSSAILVDNIKVQVCEQINYIIAGQLEYNAESKYGCQLDPLSERGQLIYKI